MEKMPHTPLPPLKVGKSKKIMNPQTNFKQKLSSRKLFDEIRKCSSTTSLALKKRFEMSFRIQKKFVNKAYFARSVHFFSKTEPL